MFLGTLQGVYAQGFNLVDRMFLESTKEEVYLYTYSVLADTDRMFAAGSSLVEKGPMHEVSIETVLSAYDTAGNKLFQKHLGNIENCERNTVSAYSCIQKIAPDLYVVGGTALDEDKKPLQGGLMQPFLIYFNKDGATLNSFTLPDNDINRGITGVTVSANKEVLCIGDAASPNGYVVQTEFGPEFITDSTYFWLCKLNSNGQLLWHKKYPNLRSMQWGTTSTKLLISPDQTTYLIAGTLNYGYPYLLKTDSSGNEIWHKALPLKESYEEHSDLTIGPVECSIDIANAPGGGYYFISTTPYWAINYLNDDTASQFAFYYGKLNELGDTLWTKQYQPYDAFNTNYGRQIQVAANGDLIITGNLWKKNNYGNSEDRTCVFRTDSLGNVKWYREPMNYTTAQNNMTTYHDLWSLSLTPDHDGILAGGLYIGHYDPSLSTQPNNGNTFSWLILMDSLGQRCPEDTVLMDVPSPCPPVVFEGPVGIKPVTAAANSILIYPNPAYDKVNISIEGDEKLFSGAQINICDVQGRTILSTKFKPSEPSIDVSALMKGIYIVTLKTANGHIVAKQKLVKQ